MADRSGGAKGGHHNGDFGDVSPRVRCPPLLQGDDGLTRSARVRTPIFSMTRAGGLPPSSC